MYVGACYLKDYPRFTLSAALIETHIISDVYLGMLFVMISKLNFVGADDSSFDLDRMHGWC